MQHLPVGCVDFRIAAESTFGSVTAAAISPIYALPNSPLALLDWTLRAQDVIEDLGGRSMLAGLSALAPPCSWARYVSRRLRRAPTSRRKTTRIERLGSCGLPTCMVLEMVRVPSVVASGLRYEARRGRIGGSCECFVRAGPRRSLRTILEPSA